MIKVVIKQNLRLDTADLRKDDYKFDENLPKKQIGKYRGYKVYEVDGEVIK
jgi:CRISPR/Cas system endoribonuclease Cas6 (RAMP superfamily)